MSSNPTNDLPYLNPIKNIPKESWAKLHGKGLHNENRIRLDESWILDLTEKILQKNLHPFTFPFSHKSRFISMRRVAKGT